jgi:hypothetical protein
LENGCILYSNEKERFMKIVFLHGLESVTNCDKVKWLREEGHEVLNPKMIYASKYMYKNVLAEIKEFKPDVIIGSSIGGYFAYEICRELNITGLLFNPALHSRPFEPVVSDTDKLYTPMMHIVLGKDDDVIDPKLTQEYLWNNYDNYHTMEFDFGHRVPVDILDKTISTLSSNEDYFITDYPSA